MFDDSRDTGAAQRTPCKRPGQDKSFERDRDESEMADASVEKIKFETLLARSDIVSVHTPLAGETEGTFGGSAFRSIRQRAVFVNTARGGIVNESALEDGEIAAAGLDVHQSEPPDPSPLSEMASVVLIPHVAWYSEDVAGYSTGRWRRTLPGYSGARTTKPHRSGSRLVVSGASVLYGAD